MAACKSEFVGKIFLKCGAKHVVCIKTGEQVLDEAAIAFTKTFYTHIFSGVQVCKAFERAKNSVSFKICEGESSIFKLFVKEQLIVHSWEDMPEIKASGHSGNCYHFERVKDGQLNNISDHNIIKKLAPRQKCFMFREKEIYNILERMIVNQEKMMFIGGMRGIGKSSLIKFVQHFLSQRKRCTKGNMFIECKNLTNYYAFVKTL